MSELPIKDLQHGRCAGAGCTETFPIDALPADWTWLVMYRWPKPELNLLRVVAKPGAMLRDAALCPLHSGMIDNMMEQLGG